MKKKEYKIIQTILVGTIIVTLLVAGLNLYQLVSAKTVKGTRYDSYKNEYYVIGNDPTKYQIEKFEELTAALDESPRDNKKVADLVSQSFVIDFFGWSNKQGAYDVGGLQYMFNAEDFYKVAHFEYYQKLDVYNQSIGSLPEIKDVTSTTIKADDYKIEDKNYKSFESTVSFKYSDSALKTQELINSLTIRTIVEDSGKVSIVNIKMVDEDEQSHNEKNNDQDFNEVDDTEEGDY